MKKLIVALCLVLFSTVAFAEDNILFDKNQTADVYIVKHSLVQETNNIRTIWIEYKYTKTGSKILKQDIKTNDYPASSKVKYAFDCSNRLHKVLIAMIYNKKGINILKLSDGEVEEVTPGSVGEAIRDLTCSVDMQQPVKEFTY